MKNVKKMLLLSLCVMTLGLTACGNNGANGTDGTMDGNNTVNDATDGTYDNNNKNNNNTGTENGNLITDTVEGVGEGVRDTVDGVTDGVRDTADGVDRGINDAANDTAINNTNNNNR